MQSHDTTKTELKIETSWSHSKKPFTLNDMMAFYQSELKSSSTGITCESSIVKFHAQKCKKINSTLSDDTLLAASWLFYHAGVNCNKKNYAKAVEYFECISSFVQLEVLDARYYGCALFYSENYEGAIREFEKLKEVSLSFDDALRMHRYLGDSYYRTKKFGDAALHLISALEMALDRELALAPCFEEEFINGFICKFLDAKLQIFKAEQSTLYERTEKLSDDELVKFLSMTTNANESNEIASIILLNRRPYDIGTYQKLVDLYLASNALNKADCYSILVLMLHWRHYKKDRSTAPELILSLKKHRKLSIISSTSRSIDLHLILLALSILFFQLLLGKKDQS